MSDNKSNEVKEEVVAPKVDVKPSSAKKEEPKPAPKLRKSEQKRLEAEQKAKDEEAARLAEEEVKANQAPIAPSQTTAKLAAILSEHKKGARKYLPNKTVH